MSNPTLSKKKIIIVVLVIAIITVLGVLAVIWFSAEPSRYPWLFKGAYAEYFGESSLGAIMCFKVLDFNGTHVQLNMYVFMWIQKSPIHVANKTEWIKIEEIHKAPTLLMQGNYTLTDTYQEEIYLTGLGERNCTVYEYKNHETIQCYIDKQTGWIIKMKTTLTLVGMDKFHININLEETNIPQLKK